jgi:thiamine-monophosphate kinase
VRLGVWLGRNRAASACVDLSDGLADGVHRIAEASRVGMVIDADALPIDDAARSALESDPRGALAAAISGSDDYELLFTMRPSMRRRHLAGASRQGGAPLTRIGVCTPEPGVRMRTVGGETPLPGGYTHFGRTGVEPSGR